MTLRIAHVTATFPPHLGGTGNVCYQHARQLARRGHHVEVFTAAADGHPKCEVLNDITVNRLQSALTYGNARLLPDLHRHLRGFDVIHLHYPFFGGETAAVASFWRRTPLVITYHQDVLLKGPLKVVEYALRHTLGRFVLRTANSVLFTTLDYGQSSYARSLLRDRTNRMAELPNGVDTAYYTLPTSREMTVDHDGHSSNRFAVLLVAALDRAHYFKGVDVLLDALTRLPGNIDATIVGDGDMRAEYERRARELGLDNRVTFTGRLSDDDLRSRYQAADVTVLPSTTMGEAFGLVLVESMACGTPVIASDLPGVRSVVANGVDGYLTPPGDVVSLVASIQRMFELPIDRRMEMGMAGRRKVEQFYSWDRIGDRLEAIYIDVLTGGAHVHARA
jgi:glycosyltransferase involved in cell wall biosynthesis